MLRISWAMALTLMCLTPQLARAGWPFFSETGVRRGSPEWYEMRAGDPPGTRQRYKYGKIWPMQPRPDGPPQTAVHKYHSTHYWPLPYICEDRSYVSNMFEMQKLNGWASATTLYDYHFDPATNELNTAGQRHVYWIMAHAPEQYRQAYVASSLDAGSNSARMMSVERQVSLLAANSTSIPVSLRMGEPAGRPATEVDYIFEQIQTNTLPPKIQYTSAGGGGGGGGN